MKFDALVKSGKTNKMADERFKIALFYFLSMCKIFDCLRVMPQSKSCGEASWGEYHGNKKILIFLRNNSRIRSIFSSSKLQDMFYDLIDFYANMIHPNMFDNNFLN